MSLSVMLSVYDASSRVDSATTFSAYRIAPAIVAYYRVPAARRATGSMSARTAARLAREELLLAEADLATFWPPTERSGARAVASRNPTPAPQNCGGAEWRGWDIGPVKSVEHRRACARATVCAATWPVLSSKLRPHVSMALPRQFLPPLWSCVAGPGSLVEDRAIEFATKLRAQAAPIALHGFKVLCDVWVTSRRTGPRSCVLGCVADGSLCHDGSCAVLLAARIQG